MRQLWNGFLFCLLLLALIAQPVNAQKVPDTVQALWADFDPRREPLDIRTVREWERDGIVYRYVTFHIGSFKDRPARMAAFYGFPRLAKRLPNGDVKLFDATLGFESYVPLIKAPILWLGATNDCPTTGRSRGDG